MWKPAISATLLLAGCDSFLCGNDVLHERASPDGKYVATVFERNCGATTPFVRAVSLRPAGTKFVPGDFDAWVFSIQNQPDLDVSWEGDLSLVVHSSSYYETGTKLAGWRDVSVTFTDRPDEN